MARTLAQNRYRILELLGSGTFAEVWAVLDRRLEVERAVKVLRADVDPSLGAQLSREARVLARISHPAVVHVYDVFTDTVDGAERTCVVMEKCDESLGDRVVRDGPVPEAQALAWFDALADGLAKAHALGVIHRDVKPHNILLVAGEARLADFGLALLGSSVDVVTRTSAVVGTVAFMAEAVRKGEAHTPETDRYGLAASLVYAVTGQLPGDLLRAGNRAGLSEGVRARVEAWVGAVETPVAQLTVRGSAARRGLVLAGLVASGVAGGVGVYTLAPRTVDPLDEVIPGWSDLPDCGLDLKFGRREKYPRWETDPALPREGWSVAAGDFNGDGRKDVAVGFKVDPVIVIWFGSSTEVLTEPETFRLDEGVAIRSLSTVEEDGAPADLAWIGGESGRLFISDLTSEGQLETRTVGTAGAIAEYVFADQDGDGCTDLAYSTIARRSLGLRTSDCRGGLDLESSVGLMGDGLFAWPGAGGVGLRGTDGALYRWIGDNVEQVAPQWPGVTIGSSATSVALVSTVFSGNGAEIRLGAVWGGQPCRLSTDSLPQLQGATVLVDLDDDGRLDFVRALSAPYGTSNVEIVYGSE